MKALFIRYVSLYMALQVLVASTGIAYTEHFCRVKGREITVFSNHHPHTCCGQSKEIAGEGIKRKSCCKDQQFFKKISTDASKGFSVKAKTQPIPLVVFIACHRYALCQNSSSSHRAFALPAGQSPPLSGPQRCILFSTFLI